MMDVVESLKAGPDHTKITTVDFHTSGEATRIVISGFPRLSGSLLAQRRELQQHHDHVRRRIILEPRGHWDMYGALLVADTELVESGDADIGVLFMTNDGWSTMCGHATIALGRFLVDTHDLDLFPRRTALAFDREKREIRIRLHAPCGVVRVIVPTNEDGTASDKERPVSYESVPSFVTALDVKIQVPQHLRWKELGDRGEVTVNFAYGGAFYALVDEHEIGFPNGLCPSSEHKVDIEALRQAADAIIGIVNGDAVLKRHVIHSVGSEDLNFLYSVIITESRRGTPREEATSDTELGLCFFADSQIDRSPTGSGVQARVARAYARGELSQDESRTYHSIVTQHFGGNGGFTARWVREVENTDAQTDVSRKAVIVRVSGYAYYTGTSTFVFEPGDRVGSHGFSLKETCMK